MNRISTPSQEQFRISSVKLFSNLNWKVNSSSIFFWDNSKRINLYHQIVFSFLDNSIVTIGEERFEPYTSPLETLRGVC